jgi:hypothetical protein
MTGLPVAEVAVMDIEDRVTQRHLRLLPTQLTCLPAGRTPVPAAAPCSAHSAAVVVRLHAVQQERLALEGRLAGLLREERELRLRLALVQDVAPVRAELAGHGRLG